MPIATEGIVSTRRNALRDFIAGDGIVDYYVETRKGSRTRFPVDREEARYIRRELTFLDSVTGLRFRQTRTYKTADLYFLQVEPGFFARRGDADGTQAETAFFDDGRTHDLFWVYWEDGTGRRLKRGELSDSGLIRHEIGHVLHLDHPYGDPRNPAYTREDTIMSYLKTATSGSNPPWTESDLAALQSEWGVQGTNYDLWV